MVTGLNQYKKIKTVVLMLVIECIYTVYVLFYFAHKMSKYNFKIDSEVGVRGRCSRGMHSGISSSKKNCLTNPPPCPHYNSPCFPGTQQDCFRMENGGGWGGGLDKHVILLATSFSD